MKHLPLLCLLLLGLLAAPAAADSLVYTKDGNVWAAGADGSSQVRLTQDGSPQTPYETPSQADDGTVLAVRGSRLVKLDRSGRQTASFGSVLTDKPSIVNAFGPWDAKLSPDGSKIAYWLGIIGGWTDYSTGIYYADPQSAVVYQSATDGRQLGSTMFYEQPSWTADSQHLLLFDELNGGVPQVARAGVGASHNDAQGWFHDLDTFTPGPEGWHPIGAGELSRDGSRLAVLRAVTNAGNGGSARGKGNRVTLYTAGGFDRPPQAMVCGFTEDHGGELGPPTWSPDGRRLAWAAPDGIHVGTIGDPASCDGWSEQLVVPGGNEPDWGPAPIQASTGDPGANAAPIAVRSRAKIKRRALRRRGLLVRVTCPSACRVDARLRLRKRVIGAAKAKRASAGEVKLRVRGRGPVRRGAKLRLTVKVRPTGAAAETIRRSVRVR
jgi:hypothetical protein